MSATTRGRAVAAIVTTLVVLALVALAVVVVVGRSHAGRAAAGDGPGGGGPASTASPPPTICPLTGVRPPGGVPIRPALAVKVENLPEARPQTGLAQADIVYEEPVEAN